MTNLVDYRDRASVLIWVVLMTLAAQRMLSLPARVLTTTLFGSPVTLMITTNTILGALLAGLVASGTDAVVRANPFSGSVDPGNSFSHLTARGAGNSSLRRPIAGRWIFWGLPIALVLVALLLLPVAPSRLYWLTGLVITGVLLGLNMAGIYYTIEPFATGYRRARLGMNALTYLLALMLFLVVYRTRARSIISATEIMVVSSLLALELLRGSHRPLVLMALYAGIVGLVLGQVTWALNYWRLDSLTGGLVLLLLFYNFVGLAQHALQARITRRVLLEFALITLAAFALIWEFSP
jgi:hypothetical protein